MEDAEIAVGLDVLLPNSRAEADLSWPRGSPVSTGDLVVARLGIDPAFAEGDGSASAMTMSCRQRGGFRLLCAARLEARQEPAPPDPGVRRNSPFRSCSQAPSTKTAGLRGSLRRGLADERGADVVPAAPRPGGARRCVRRRPRVHALPSLWESVGLSSVEAPLIADTWSARCMASANISATMWYCEAESVEDVRDAVAWR